MNSYKDYLDPGFKPQKITIARLREILDAHNIHYTGREKKAGLIRIFNTQVRPLIRVKETELTTLTSEIENKPSSYSVRSSPRRWSINYGVIFAMLIILIGFLFKYDLGTRFCDDTEFSNVSVNYSGVPSATCTPCPSNAHCSKDKIISCDKGFILVSSSIHWLKPFTSRCILDLSLARKVKKYTELLKSIAAEETGKVECENGLRENLLFKNLLILLLKKKFVNMEYLKSDDDIEVIYRGSKKSKIYIISKNPKRSLVCRLKPYIIHKIDFCKAWVRENIKLLIGLSLILIVYFISRKVDLIYSIYSIYSPQIPEIDSTIEKTEMTLLSNYDEDYISIANYFHTGLPHNTIIGILKLKMPAEIVRAHASYKKRNCSSMSTYIMFHGTKSLCDPKRFITNPHGKFCKARCGVCGIVQEGNKTKYASTYYSEKRHMWFANSSYTSYYYCNRYNSMTSAMFVVEVVSRYGDSITIIDCDAVCIS
ncbi:Man1-Src1p-C-terminal domain-containing protein [Gigaspora rosea]|uniref:Man1-Src1p-C-terminal domain-containing protein n=1 Tax=Gigaspora rosea TaxID=44941 RepID=A0A397UHM8_9GLOM|nr:Man1-Src1p-C-terminal domain-containing protein [Gigaspora rosea]